MSFRNIKSNETAQQYQQYLNARRNEIKKEQNSSAQKTTSRNIHKPTPQPISILNTPLKVVKDTMKHMQTIRKNEIEQKKFNSSLYKK